MLEEQSSSPLESARKTFVPRVPALLRNLKSTAFAAQKESLLPEPAEEIARAFPKTARLEPLLATQGSEKRIERPLVVGALFSGGQAPGGHNVIAGLFDALRELHPQSQLLGFLNGPEGVLKKSTKPLNADAISSFRNLGGFHLIGSGRTKIETKEQFAQALDTVNALALDGLVIIGGDDSNTNAAALAEFFREEGCSTCVIGVPKTIDGDLKNPYVATSFGFDTACKTYSELIGNIGRDALSARKYTHFIRLMGRSASHITLECALATHPNCAFIGEEVASEKKSLKQISEELTQLIVKRVAAGKNYGVILVPEGLIEFIPEVRALIQELNRLVADKPHATASEVASLLNPQAASCFSSLPERIQEQLLLRRDPHGNVQVSFIATEQLLIELVQRNLDAMRKRGEFSGKFSPTAHFFGYEGRSGYPSNFDCNYCEALGRGAALFIAHGLSGYLCALHDLARDPKDWGLFAVPLTRLMHMEHRKGKPTPVVRKALVDLQGPAFQRFQAERETWALEDRYLCPGPIQFYGDPALTDSVPHSIR